MEMSGFYPEGNQDSSGENKETRQTTAGIPVYTWGFGHLTKRVKVYTLQTY